MLGYLLGDMLSVIIVKHTAESVIVSSRRCLILFLSFVLKFPSDREDFHSEMYILLNLIDFEPFGIGAKLGSK